MKKNKLTTALTVLGLFCVNLLLAQTTIRGTVTDAETDAPIPGVNIVIQGTTEGTNTDFDGNFTFSTSQDAPFTIEVSSVGFTTQSVEVTSADQVINLALQPGEKLDEIIVSASRRPQKVQDAPASVSIVSAKDIENSAVAVDPVRHLVNVPGVQIQQQSANTLNIEMRAGSGVFGTSALPILDYRFLTNPSAGTFFTQQAGLSNIDIAKIEVVRGAASALYGPGVTSGVVHFMSKNPIDYPGTTVELLGGEMNTLGAALRHAYASENKKFGYKINVKYTEGDDFQLNGDERVDEDGDGIADATTIAGFQRAIYQPAIRNNMVDPTDRGDLLLSMSDLDDNYDGNPLATRYQNFAANGHLEFRPDEDTSAFLSAGFAQGGALFFNSQGAGYQDGRDYWTQARVQKGGLFALVSYNYRDGGGTKDPTFLYNSGFRQVAETRALEAQLQYNFDVPSFLNSNFTVGADHRSTKSNSAYTLYGRNEDNDDYIITGAYLQGTSVLSDQLELTYAARYDQFNILDEGGFSPRVALVYKMNEKNTFRATYNIATAPPSALQTFIDFPVNVIVPNEYDVWLSGQVDAQGFAANAPISLAFLGGTEIPQGSSAIPNVVLAGALTQLGASDAAVATIQNDPRFAALAPFADIVGDALANPAALLGALAAAQNSSGILGRPDGAGGLIAGEGYNVFNGQPLAAGQDTGAAVLNTLNSFEVGYKGIIGDKLSVAVDFYTYERQGFTQFTAIGPTYAFGPDTRDATTAALAGGDRTNSFALDVAQALGPIIGAQVGQRLGQILGGPPPAALVAQTVQGLAGVTGSVFAGAQGTLPAEALAVFGTIESDRVPGDSPGARVTHLPAGYRQYDDATRSHYGIDAAVEYFATDNTSLWANASWVSQNEWIPGEDNDDDLPFSSFLNSPQFKYRAGIRYSKENTRASITFQHDDAFTSDQGFWAGTVQEKNLFDANIGYTLSNGLRFDLTGSNIFDFKYRAFPGMPIIGRRIIAKLTFDL